MITKWSKNDGETHKTVKDNDLEAFKDNYDDSKKQISCPPEPPSMPGP